MSIHTNILPIQFGGGGLVPYSLDHNPIEALVQHRDGIEFGLNGSRWFLPFGGTKPAEHTEIFSAGRLGEAARLWMLHMLKEALTQYGEIATENSTLQFRPHAHLRLFRTERFDLHLLDLHDDGLGICVSIPSGQGVASGLREVGAFLEFLSKLSLDNGLGTQAFFPESTEVDRTLCGGLADTSLIFSSNDRKIEKSKAGGLMKYGPYSGDQFQECLLNCLVITRSSKRGIVERFLAELRDGIDPASADSPWGQPWAKRFRFAGMDLRIALIPDMTEQALEAAIQAESDAMGKQHKKFDVAIYECGSNGAADEAKGLLARALLLGRGIPSQALTQAMMDLSDDNRAKAMRDLGLRLYALAGGTPWLVPLLESISSELVLGLGHTALGTGTLGFSTVFTAHGHYRLGNFGFKTKVQDWEAELGGLIAEQVEQVAADEGWEFKRRVRLLFHLGKACAPETVDKIRSTLMMRFGGKYDLVIGFLAVETDHLYQLWDSNRGGVRLGQNTLGQYAPLRGESYQFHGGAALLQLAIPELSRQYPRPLLIKRLPNSDDWGFGHLLSQVYNFAHMSYESTDLDPLPVTLAYGNAICDLVHKLHTAGLLPTAQRGTSQLYHIPWYL